ncbi:hypothetical protein RDV78_04240 [Bacillota bacterium LX-D]|nr:hypothetical protein [Bacillota bacterium LX-D]
MADPIRPGVCPPNGCPPPTRIECIKVDKVYDSCFQVDDKTRTTRIPTADYGTGPFAVGDKIPCRLYGDITCEEIRRASAGGGFSTITLLVKIPVRLTNPKAPASSPKFADRTFTFTKTVTLCCPEGVSPDCSETTLLFCNCIVTDVASEYIEVTCDFQVCLVIKCILEVQLLVPSYGFCTPSPCVTLPGVCPPTPAPQCF